MFQFGDGITHIRHRYNAQANETIGGHRTVLLGQPIIVGAHDRLIGVIIRNTAPQPRAAHLSGVDHLGIETIAVLFSHPLFGRTRSRRALIGLAKGLPVLAPFATVKIGRYFPGRLSLDHPGITPGGGFDQSRCPFPVRGWHPV